MYDNLNMIFYYSSILTYIFSSNFYNVNRGFSITLLFIFYVLYNLYLIIFNILYRIIYQSKLRGSLLKIHYEELLNNISDSIFEIDKKGTYTYCSETISKLLGYSSDEIIGKVIFNFMTKPEAKRVKHIFALHTSNKEPIVDCETVYIHKDGHEITVTINAIPILDESGDVVNYQGILKDISKEKSKLKETYILEERLRLALRGSNDGVWDWNIIDNSVYFSPRWKEMIGYKDNELPNEVPTWTDRIHPDDLEATWASINEHINSQTEYYEGIHRLKHKDGHWVWILDKGKALYDTAGKATRMIGTHTDITEEKAMHLKSLHQKQIIEQIHDSVISTDLDGIITSWNSGSETLLGYTAKEAIGKNISLIYLDEEIKLLKANIYLLLKYGGHNLEARMITKNQDILLVDLSLSILKDEKSNPVGLIGYARDITQKRKAENTLEQQSKRAQMGEMISMIAHQWRQPLNAISLTASNLKLKFDFGEYSCKSEQDFNQCREDFSKGLSQIEEYIRVLSTTIDDFRNFYKTDKIPVSVRLDEIVPKALNIIAPSLQNNHITVIEEYNSSQKIKIYGNEVMQVVLTLLQNSQENFLEKKTKEPYIKIIVKNKMISVCDNGGGVPKKILKKIFDPYFSTKIEKNGSGLGLYMSKTIIEQHHKGKLTVKNIADGACFTIKFM